jgi:hypothetical protein
MSLYTRLLGQDAPGIQVHTFMSAIGEWQRGFMTQAQVVALFTLSPSEETEAAALLARIVDPRESVTLATVPAGHTLTNVGTTFDAIPGSQNLGFAAVQSAGITQVTFGVRVNKVGAGTQFWQLWNDTDGVEVAVISDAGATGIKYLQTTQTFPSPLGPGIKIARVRARSTTAADDPVFFSAFMSIQRASNLTTLELHEVLLLGEYRGSPYTTEAALKARLGVA